GKYDDSDAHDDMEETSSHITPIEKKALFWANMSFIVLLVLLIICAIPEHSFLRNAKTGSLLDDAPLINGVGLIILVIF
ncbi:AbgT family transporter, partial [Staphylococcus caprae]